MSYLVLARKWRPQRFEDIVGQPHISNTLKNAIKENRVAHAFLFCGMRGIGKTTTARILAKALNCHNPIESEPCCECPSCIQISNGNSMDVIEIDGASNNSVDDIRELREKVKFRPNRDKYKIYIIDEVHQLSNQAFNALLKTLEEPPEHIIFIFATTEFHKIPMTILSRCQRHNFRKIDEKEMKHLLEKIAKAEKLTIDAESMSLISWASEGSMRDAQSLLDQAIAYCGEDINHEKIAEILGIIDRKFLSDIYICLADGDKSKIFEIVNTIVSSGYNISLFHDKLIEFNRDLTIIKLVKDKSKYKYLSQEECKSLDEIAKKFTLMQLQQFHKTLVDYEFQLKKSGHPRISLEMMLLKLSTVEPLLSIKEILQKIDEMSKNVSTDTVRPKTPVKRLDIEVQEKTETIHDVTQEEDIYVEETKPVNQEEKTQDIQKSELHEKLIRELDNMGKKIYSLILKDAEKIKIKEDKLILTYGHNSENYNESNEVNFLECIGDIAKKVLGKNLKVISRSNSNNNNGEKQKKIKKNKRSKKAEDLPLVVQNAIDLFNGEIING